MARGLIAIVFLGVLSACAAPDQRQTMDEPVAVDEAAARVARGQSIAEVFCVTCHAIGEGGVSPNPEAPPFRTFAQRYPLNALEEAFGEGILVGHPAMPEFQFAPDDIDALVAYLETIQEQRGS